jgi:hypothetical protein
MMGINQLVLNTVLNFANLFQNLRTLSLKLQKTVFSVKTKTSPKET